MKPPCKPAAGNASKQSFHRPAAGEALFRAEKDPKRLAPGARRCGSYRTDPLRVWATAGRRRPHTSMCSNTGAYSLRLSRSEEHTSELQSLMRISYAVFCLTKTQNT